MGFLDRVKNLFTEEYEVEEPKPIKKEMVQVEIPSPVEDVTFDLPKKSEIAHENKVETKRDRSEMEPERVDTKRENTRKAVFFDEKDFMDLEKTQEIKKQQQVEHKKETYGTKKVEEKKKFRPTPIISPVYGILDKNYHKEDITNKSAPRASYTINRKVTVDEVRNKAFGTLEDELETTLVNTSILFNDELDRESNIESSHDDLFDDLMDHETNRTILEDDNDIEVTADDEINRNMTLEELDNMERSKTRTRRSKKVAASEEDSISNSELFDLVDSMYDKGDE